MIRSVHLCRSSTSRRLSASALFAAIILSVVCAGAWAKEGTFPWKKYHGRDDAWFTSEKAALVAENLLTYRSQQHIWPKNLDTSDHPFAGPPGTTHGTFDNGATVGEIRYLARIFRATGKKKYRQAVKRAIDTILESQYPNGGWPQSYPAGNDYPRHITFNDDVMVNLLQLVRDVANHDDFSFLTRRRAECRAAFALGIECVLRCQIRIDQLPTAWCAQHDSTTLLPRSARAYEPISLSGAESASVVLLLMSLDNPSPDVVRAIDGACRWFQEARIYNLRVVKKEGDTQVVIDPNADPLWARFYAIGTNRPLFIGRDSIIRFDLSQIERERRTGYNWYGAWGAPVLNAWPLWQQQHLRSTMPVGDRSPSEQ